MRLHHPVRHDILIFINSSKACENWGLSPIICHCEKIGDCPQLYVIANEAWQSHKNKSSSNYAPDSVSPLL